MSALEDAASAVNDILTGKDDGTSIREGARRMNRPLCLQIARAVITGIYNPPTEAVEAAASSMNTPTWGAARWGYQMILDAILAQEPK